jgi:hypothetical protein
VKAFVDWLLSKRYAIVVMAIVLSPILSPAGTALIALQTAHRGVATAIGDALVASLGVGITVLLLYGGATSILVEAVVGMFVGVALGAAIVKHQSLSLVFQWIVLTAYVLFAAFVFFVPDAPGFATAQMDELVAMLREAQWTEDQVAIIRGWETVLIGLQAAGIFLGVSIALFLAYWLLAIAHEDGRFGKEFRQLRIGMVLGIPGALVFASGLVFRGWLVQNATALVVAIFLVQGLAVVHAWVHAKKLHPFFLVPPYVLFVPPFTAVGVLGLSSLGFIDNILNLRSKFGSQEA